MAATVIYIFKLIKIEKQQSTNAPRAFASAALFFEAGHELMSV